MAEERSEVDFAIRHLLVGDDEETRLIGEDFLDWHQAFERLITDARDCVRVCDLHEVMSNPQNGTIYEVAQEKLLEILMKYESKKSKELREKDFEAWEDWLFEV